MVVLARLDVSPGNCCGSIAWHTMAKAGRSRLQDGGRFWPGRSPWTVAVPPLPGTGLWSSKHCFKFCCSSLMAALNGSTPLHAVVPILVVLLKCFAMFLQGSPQFMSWSCALCLLATLLVQSCQKCVRFPFSAFRLVIFHLGTPPSAYAFLHEQKRGIKSSNTALVMQSNTATTASQQSTNNHQQSIANHESMINKPVDGQQQQ